MGVIAEKCPWCHQISRCVVSERGSIFGGLVFGIPFVLPVSGAQCVCGNCGHAFRGRATVEERAIPAELAVGVDIDTLLRLTNPELQHAQVLTDLRSDPQLQGAVALYDRLSPGSLRFDLGTELAQWPILGEHERSDLLDRVIDCANAEQFARGMAARYSLGATGCLLGVAVTGAIWTAAWLILEHPGILGWTLVVIVGLAAGSMPYKLFAGSRDRRWVRDVLFPEAARDRVSLGWLLEILENTGMTRSAGDDFGLLRELAPVIRTELDADDRSREAEVQGFRTTADHQPSVGMEGGTPSTG